MSLPDESGEPEPEYQGALLHQILNPTVDRRLRRLPKLMSGAVSLVWAAARREFLVTGILQALSAASLAVQLLVGRRLLSHLLAPHGKGFSSSIPDLIVLSVAVAVVSVANLARFELQQVLAERVSRHSFAQVITASTSVDLAAFESSSYQDRLQRALINAGTRSLQMTTGILSLVGSLLGVAAIGVALLTIQPLFFLLAVVAVVPLWLATLRAGRALYRFGFAQTERDRRRMYLQLLLTHKDAAKEVRSYGLGQFLAGRWDDLYAERITDLRAVVRQRLVRGTFSSLITSALTGGSVGLLIWFVASHRLSLAGAGAAAGGILLLGSQLQGLISGAGGLYESSLFVQDFFDFLDSAPSETHFVGVDSPPDTFEMLQAKRVSFTYPSRKQPALQEVSVDIGRGQVVALVGENGSGKSTLAKVLAGLYLPSHGTVCWDGTDIAGFDQHLYRDRTAVLFQDFVRYQLTAGENVSVGRWQRYADLEGVEAAAHQAGAHDLIADLPAGYGTQLGPEFFGGVDLSGGQWQRIALARAFFRNAPLVILDEPTAALDPRAEAELFASVRELFAGRSVLLISHRFASVRLADYIYVLHEGRVVEQGRHQDLMDAAGLYAELFALQASAYLPPTTPSTVRPLPSIRPGF